MRFTCDKRQFFLCILSRLKFFISENTMENYIKNLYTKICCMNYMLTEKFMHRHFVKKKMCWVCKILKQTNVTTVTELWNKEYLCSFVTRYFQTENKVAWKFHLDTKCSAMANLWVSIRQITDRNSFSKIKPILHKINFAHILVNLANLYSNFRSSST